MKNQLLTIIVPVYNESDVIQTALQNLLQLEGDYTVTVVDGGSNDGTFELAGQIAADSDRLQVLQSPGSRGRASQMNYGAAQAHSEWLLFLHIDCALPQLAVSQLQQVAAEQHPVAGGFYKKYAPESLLLRVHRVGMNLFRTRLLRNLVGTNAIFVRTGLFRQCGGYPEVPIMEEVILWDKLKRSGKTVFLKPHVVCSARRYESGGVARRIVMAAKVLYLFRVRRVPVEELMKIYHGG